MTFYFAEKDSSDTKFFHKDTLKTVLFILLGFTLYYILIQPNIPVKSQHPIIRNIGNDSLMFGTVLLSYHALKVLSGEAEVGDPEFWKKSGLILVAFAAYRVTLDQFIPFNKIQPKNRNLVADWAQFGTFLIAYRALEGKSLTDTNWWLSVLYALVGFGGYHLVSKKLIQIQ